MSLEVYRHRDKKNSFSQHAVTCPRKYPAAMSGDQLRNDSMAGAEGSMRPLLIGLHQVAIANNVNRPLALPLVLTIFASSGRF
ncbi:hypothetical protein [Rhizobium leguminosarum]